MTARPTRSYASKDMHSRRERVVRIARQILAEGGPDALTINRLSREADVAPSTIYRGFDNKDGVILATIVDHMNGIRDYLRRSPPRGDLDSIYAEYDWIVAELYRDPAYARVVIDFYFSSDARADARRALRSVAETRISDWVTRADQRGALVPALNRDRLIEYQVDTEYIVLHKWARHLLVREQVAGELKANFLMAIAAAVRQSERDSILDRLTRLHDQLGTPPIKAMLAAG